MITDDKVTELFCMADDFCKFFDAMMEKSYAEIRHQAALSPRFDYVKGRNHIDYDIVP